jgi:beta-glucosidase
MSKFPQDFKWGVATSSYQIEGATNVDGRGESIWDRFCATEGKVANGENGDIACDHYNLFAEDVALMKSLGVSTYRFSLAWPRLFPNGDKQREQRGFDFYNRLIDELIANDITPVITLYHWDLPQMLEDKGGWANREIVYDFAFYAGEAVQAFSDRVKEWITINEPWCVSWLGYMIGVHAPGVKNLDSALAAAHHTALAHAEATRIMKAIDPSIKTGIALNMTTYRIKDESDPELAELGDLMDAQLNRWWIDAFLNGRYPKSIAEFHKERLAKIVQPGDLEKLKVQTDYLAVNYYSDSFIGLPRESDGPMSDGGLFPFPHRNNGTPPEPYTDMGWPITPVGLEDLLVRIATDWPEIAEIVISENGAAYDDEPNAAGDVEDHRRIDYLVSHLDAASRAIDRGAPLTGYYAWSLMDNFEWAEGYSKRFGIIHVDFTTLKRTIKNSGKTYAAIIAANRLDANSGVK